MLQSFSTVYNHTCVSEKSYKLILNPIIRSTLKIKNPILHNREGAGSVPLLLAQLNTSKSVNDMNL